MYTIPGYCDLDGVVEVSPLLEGVTLMTLKACDTFHVRTRNSDYEIFMLDPRSGRVRTWIVSHAFNVISG